MTENKFRMGFKHGGSSGGVSMRPVHPCGFQLCEVIFTLSAAVNSIFCVGNELAVVEHCSL